MNLVNRLKASRLVTRIKSSPIHEDEVQDLVARFVSFGPDVIPILLDALGHGLVRPIALEALDTLMTAKTEHLYLEGLTSSNPAVLSGIEKLFSERERFDATILLDLLSRRDINRAVAEHILSAHADHIPSSRLLEALDGGTKEVQGVVLRLLDQNCTQSAVPELLNQLSSPHWHVRMYVLRILARFPEEHVIKAITKCLEDQNQEVRKEALKTLGRAKVHGAAPAIVPLLRDQNIRIQSAAIDALCSLGSGETVPELLEFLKDESEYVRRAAVEVLNAIATADAIQDLVRALRDADWWVRVRAADALGTLGGDHVVAAVTDLLEDSDEFLRRYAVEILITVPSERAVEPLLNALKDPDWWVRERCIDALGETRDSRAVVPLMDLIGESPEVVALCARALGRIGDPLALEALGALCDSQEEDVMRNAKAAVAAIKAESRAGGNKLSRSAPGKSVLDDNISSVQSGANLINLEGVERKRITPTPAADPHPQAKADPPGKDIPQTPVPVTPVDYWNLPAGTVLLDRYTVGRRVGSGGFGVVYLVHDSAVGEDLILKILNPLVAQEGTGLDRFVRELKLSRRVTHGNVIRIHDFMNLGGTHAVSMEYFSSRDLGKIIDQDGSLPWERSIHIASQICCGLAAAHKEGVIHRDIKPPNILVGEGDEVKIVDFGLAAMEHQGSSRLTKSGLLVGTPEYIAPEQISEQSVDHRADLYAVGVILYEMISGEPPFSGETAVKTLFQHLEGEAHPLRELVPGLPQAVYDLVEKALAREPEDRPPDAADMEAMCLAILNKRAA